MPDPQRCPVHAEPDADILNAWPCPDECPEFLAELDRRIDDVQINGNYVKTWRGDDGVRYKQAFRSHQPVEEPQPDPFYRNPRRSDEP